MLGPLWRYFKIALLIVVFILVALDNPKQEGQTEILGEIRDSVKKSEKDTLESGPAKNGTSPCPAFCETIFSDDIFTMLVVNSDTPVIIFNKTLILLAWNTLQTQNFLQKTHQCMPKRKNEIVVCMVTDVQLTFTLESGLYNAATLHEHFNITRPLRALINYFVKRNG